MPFSVDDLSAIWLTLKLASLTTRCSWCWPTPLAWWLARTGSRWRSPVAAVVALPLVLPPTVLGFYLLVSLGPHGPGGQFTQALGIGLLPFTFGGLLLGSINLFTAFRGTAAAARLRGDRQPADGSGSDVAGASAGHVLHVALPLARPGFVTAAILSFAHTVGEFGVVLMIGGNIPNQTRVVSTQIYGHVEAMEYAQAHWLAGSAWCCSHSWCCWASRWSIGARSGCWREQRRKPRSPHAGALRSSN